MSTDEKLREAAANGDTQEVQRLIAAGTRIDHQDEDGRTPLYLGARGGHYAVVEKLLAAGADINLSDKDGRMPLYGAALEGSEQVVSMLLAAGADINLQKESGFTPLYGAAFNGHGALVSLLLTAGADKNLQWKTGATPLYVAAQNGHEAVVSALLAAGADKNLQKEDGATPLFVAAQEGHEAVVSALLAAGADKNLQRETGATPLYVAAQNGHEAVVSALLAAGADKNLQIKRGATPLFIAAQKGHEAVVTALLAAGADKNLQTKDGATPLFIAAQNGHEAVVSALLAAGADKNLQREGGFTPLFSAAQNGHYDSVVTLVEAGADITLRCKNSIFELYGSRPEDVAKDEKIKAYLKQWPRISSLAAELRLAAAAGNSEKVAGILKQQLNLNLRDFETGRTALHEAAIQGSRSVVLSLLDRGANPDIQDHSGATALSLATRWGHADVIRVLLAGGADCNIQNKSASTGKRRGSGGFTLPQGYHVRCGNAEVKDLMCLQEDQPAPHPDWCWPMLKGRVTDVSSATGKSVVRRVVVKFPRGLSDASLAQLKAESDILNHINAHLTRDFITGCIDLYDSDLDVTPPYLVLERFGRDITSLLHGECEVTLSAMREVASAVAALHALNIMHGDIKPANILYIEHSGRILVKLCDLECARRVGDPFPHNGSKLLYTELYASPEVLTGKAGELKASLATDLFSLGLVLWQLAHKTFNLPEFVSNTEQRLKLLDDGQFEDTLHSTLIGKREYLLHSVSKLCRVDPFSRSAAQEIRDQLDVSMTSFQQQSVLLQQCIGQRLDSIEDKMGDLVEAMRDGFMNLSQKMEDLHSNLRTVVLQAGDEVTVALGSWAESISHASSSASFVNDPEAFEALRGQLQATVTTATNAALKEQLGAALGPILAQLRTVSDQVSESSSRGASIDLSVMLDSVKMQMGNLCSEVQSVRNDLSNVLELHRQLGRNVEQLLAENTALSRSIHTLAGNTAQASSEQAKNIAGLVISVAALQGMPRMMKEMQDEMVILLRDTHSIPTLVVVLPEVHSSFLSKANPMRLFTDRYRMFFICSHTKQLVPCGRNGDGILLTKCKAWLKTAAPVLTVGLICLKLGLLAGGVPLPLPIGGINKLLSDDGELCQQYLGSAVGLLGEALKTAGDDVLSSELLLDGLQQKLDQATAGDEAALKALHGTLGAEGTRKAYEALKQLFKDKGIDVARDSGLRQVICEGKVAWVLDKDEVEQGWKEKVRQESAAAAARTA